MLIVTLLVLGCQPPEVHDETERRGSNLQSLAGMYRMYASQSGGSPPPDEEAFKNFISAQGLKHFESFGIQSVDDLFVSPRDGQPYVVAYGGGPDDMPDVIAYEQDGLESGRWIVTSMAVVAEVDQAEFDRMVRPNTGE